MSSKNPTNLIIETLKAQAEIFGDELYFSMAFDNLIPNNDFKIQSFVTGSSEEIVPENNLNISKYSFMKNSDISENNVLPQKTEEIKTEFGNAATVEELYKKIHNCKKCALGETRNKFVFGTGNPNADIMLIGEAPGAEEDKIGEPFVGRAGQLLTKILEAINIKRDDVFIANILKCRPPNNRTPNPEEINSCIPYLKKQIDLIKPKVILCLGLTAANGLLNLKSSMIKMRGNVYEFHGVKLMVTYHPAALLRNPNWKKETWEDVQKFYQLYKDLLN
ncbi:MAG TPA: uracil-DNA glycosylase [Melioribacteraceae bacterium]|nr:uracil-DNA glycosylase [Melioribacteraceae bacterium]